MASNTSKLLTNFLFNLLLLLPTLLQALNTDGVTLLSFKYSILNDPFSVLMNWNYDDETPCSWTGVICTELGDRNMFRVTSLVLPNKQLLGSLSTSFFSISYLSVIDLSNNFFHGSLPESVTNATQLRVLALGNNNISGQLPDGVSNLASLQLLNLSANGFTGKIPRNLSLLKNLTVFDVSSNHLDGSLPLDFGGISLRYLNFSRNQISGVISPLDKVPAAAIIDLSFNNLTGPIPSTQPMLKQKAESFSGNPGLCGQPLKTLCSIPSTLSNPQNISETTSPAIAVMPKTSSPTKLPPESPNQKSKSKLNPITIVGITVADITGLAIIAMFILYIYQIKKRRNYQEEYSTFKVLKDCLEKNDTLSMKDQPKQSVFASEITKSPASKTGWGSCIRYEETKSESSEGNASDSDIENQQKTIETFNRTDGGRSKHKTETQLVTVDGETNLELDTLLKASAYVLGTSRSGIVYKAVLENGEGFAVRRIGAENCTAEKLKEFEREIQAIAKLRHQNLVRVRGFVWGNEEKLLISDYVPNGSLNCSSIYGLSSTSSQNPLTFQARLKIAKGIARGIAYIHDKKHVHGNIKPNNIVLNSESEPLITDMGLHNLITPAHLLTPGPTNSHYNPPEWSTTNHKPNPKGDIYSFGVILLELLTGKSFVDPDFVGHEKSWFLSLVDETIRADVANREDEVVAMFRLGFGCVSSLPQKRPYMKEVVQVLEKMFV